MIQYYTPFVGGASIFAILKREVGYGKEHIVEFKIGGGTVFRQNGLYMTKIEPEIGLHPDFLPFLIQYRLDYEFEDSSSRRQKGVYLISYQNVETSGIVDYRDGKYRLVCYGKKITDLIALYILIRTGEIYPVAEFDNPSGQKTAHQLAEENALLIRDLTECAIVMDASTHEILMKVRQNLALQKELDRVNAELANSNKKISKVRDELRQALESLKLSGRGCFRRLNYLRKAVKTTLNSI